MRRLVPLKYIHLRFVLYLSDTVFFHSRGKYRADFILRRRQRPGKVYLINYYHVKVFHLLGIV